MSQLHQLFSKPMYQEVMDLTSIILAILGLIDIQVLQLSHSIDVISLLHIGSQLMADLIVHIITDMVPDYSQMISNVDMMEVLIEVESEE